MTDVQPEEIRRFRLAGKSYTQISDILKLSRNTVKSICQRNDFHFSDGVGATADSEHCRNCGASISQVAGRKYQNFCSTVCRRSWWSAHRNTGIKKTAETIACEYCGKSFEDYPNNHRKFCCHACYIAYRFRKGRSHDERAI